MRGSLGLVTDKMKKNNNNMNCAQPMAVWLTSLKDYKNEAQLEVQTNKPNSVLKITRSEPTSKNKFQLVTLWPG